MLESLRIGRFDVIGGRAITTVVHAEHHGDDGWLFGENVALQALIDRASASTRNSVAPLRPRRKNAPASTENASPCTTRPTGCSSSAP